MTAIRVIPYSGWAELKRDLFIELYGDGLFRPGHYLFRGVGDANWSLQSAFDRRFAPVSADRRMELWAELADQWRQGCLDIGVASDTVRDEHKLWALGQHYGLPTRLLDWSTSPYVAAFFAFHEQLERFSEHFSQVAIWALDLRHPVWSAGAGVDIVSTPAMQNIRLRNQGGKFTFVTAPFASLEEFVHHAASGTPSAPPPARPRGPTAGLAGRWALTQCVLPATAAEHALSDLDSMGINHYHLFPDLSGLAALATMRVTLAAATGLPT